MNMMYATERLILKVLHEDSAQEVLTFYENNKDFFEPYEPDRINNFYSLNFQSAILRYEFDKIIKGEFLRYWIFLKDFPQHIIGTISFQNFVKGAFLSCSLGYKTDKQHTRNGYMTEALKSCIDIIFNDYKFHRIESYVHYLNKPSINLMQKLNFDNEGLAKEFARLNGIWIDHYRYVLIN